MTSFSEISDLVDPILDAALAATTNAAAAAARANLAATFSAHGWTQDEWDDRLLAILATDDDAVKAAFRRAGPVL